MTLTTQDNPAAGRSHRDRDSERTNMRRLYVIIYPLCLAEATASRIIGFLGRRATKPERSVFAEARSTACAAVGYAFQA